MQTKADGNFRFICHVVDHFSQFHFVYPLKTKTGEETAKMLKEKVLCYVGLPSILHTDNGSEFVNAMMKTLLVLWPGQCEFIQGNPGHSQSQGLVEHGNKTIELMISAKEHDTNTCTWASWLPDVQCEIYFKYIFHFYFFV